MKIFAVLIVKKKLVEATKLKESKALILNNHVTLVSR